LIHCSPTPRSVLSPLSLHDALPILGAGAQAAEEAVLVVRRPAAEQHRVDRQAADGEDEDDADVHVRGDDELVALLVGLELRIILDRKSTRLNSSHQIISYAVFCLKK